MANNRPVDKNKKSNIKCEHCEHYGNMWPNECSITEEAKNYWNRCKQFEWAKRYDTGGGE